MKSLIFNFYRWSMMMRKMIVFVVWLTNERRLALFPAGIIVRDPHHRKSPTLSKQGLNLQNLGSGLIE